MWASKSKKSVDLTHFESKSSGLDSGADTYSSERSSTSEENVAESICIIGSGDFGRALALRFVQSGFAVNIGSRNAERNK